MAKGLTKGRTIGLQLPLDLDAHVRERAAQAGMSPGLWITKRLNAALRVEREVGVVNRDGSGRLLGRPSTDSIELRYGDGSSESIPTP